MDGSSGMVNCFTGSSLKLQADAALAQAKRAGGGVARRPSRPNISSAAAAASSNPASAPGTASGIAIHHGVSTPRNSQYRSISTPRIRSEQPQNTPGTAMRRRGSAHHILSGVPGAVAGSSLSGVSQAAPTPRQRPRSQSVPRTPSQAIFASSSASSAAGAATAAEAAMSSSSGFPAGFNPQPLPGQAPLQAQSAQTPAGSEGQHAGDTVMVIMRARPPNATELRHEQALRQQRAELASLGGPLPPAAESEMLSVAGDGSGTVLASGKQFQFDHALGPDAAQDVVFGLAGRPIVDWCVDGYNGCILAYGNTGSGKTFTMMGPPEFAAAAAASGTAAHNGLQGDPRRGMIPRVLEYLFQQLQLVEAESRGQTRFECHCSFLELYQERFFDLLQSDPLLRQSARLSVRERADRSTFVKGLATAKVTSAAQAHQLLVEGTQRRRTAPTLLNAESSRSHTVFQVQITRTDAVETTSGAGGRKPGDEDLAEVTRHCYLNLVDLAGSENQKLTQTAGVRLKEAATINKSLSQLSRVIKELSRGRKHISYRDSKLTFLLRDSLGGRRAKTCLIACVSPSSLAEAETISTLNFASRASCIANEVEQVTGELVIKNKQTRAFIEDLQKQHAGELRKLKLRFEQQLMALREAGAGGGGGDAFGSGVSPDTLHAFLTALVAQRKTFHARLFAELQEKHELLGTVAHRALQLREEVLELRTRLKAAHECQQQQQRQQQQQEQQQQPPLHAQFCDAQPTTQPQLAQPSQHRDQQPQSGTPQASTGLSHPTGLALDNARLARELEDLRRQLQQERGDREVLEERLRRADQRAALQQQELDSRQQRLDEAEATAERLRAEHAELRVELTLARERQSDRGRQLENQLAEARRLADLNARQQAQLEELRAELTVSKEVSNRLMMKRRSMSVGGGLHVEGAADENEPVAANYLSSLDMLNTSGMGVNISMATTGGGLLAASKPASARRPARSAVLPQQQQPLPQQMVTVGARGAPAEPLVPHHQQPLLRSMSLASAPAGSASVAAGPGVFRRSHSGAMASAGRASLLQQQPAGANGRSMLATAPQTFRIAPQAPQQQQPSVPAAAVVSGPVRGARAASGLSAYFDVEPQE